MRKVPANDYKLYVPWARQNTANNVYPCSIAEGLQPGDIYVNDGPQIDAVFFWHYCGFGYISGKPSYQMLNDIYEKMTSSHSERRLVLITSDDDVTAFFRGKDVQMDYRAEYTYHPEAKNQATVNAAESTQFHIEQINPANISRIHGRIIPSFSWDSPDRFLKDGFGYIALDRENVCAVAFSAAVSSDQIDIGVETHEVYRRKGLAAMLTNCMCAAIVKIGMGPLNIQQRLHEHSPEMRICSGQDQYCDPEESTGTDSMTHKPAQRPILSTQGAKIGNNKFSKAVKLWQMKAESGS